MARVPRGEDAAAHHHRDHAAGVPHGGRALRHSNADRSPNALSPSSPPAPVKGTQSTSPGYLVLVQGTPAPARLPRPRPGYPSTGQATSSSSRVPQH
eukprot:107281-Pyramimonas_sp.AAC.1